LVKSPAPPPSARSLALNILYQARQRDRWVEDLVAATLKRYPHLPRQERAFLLELVQGVKRWELKLDWLLSQVSHLPLGKLHPLVLNILRLGVFQLLMLDRVPARAVLHEAGKVAKARGLPRAHVGFINAILRRLAAGDLPRLPSLEEDPVMALSIATSHPAWVVQGRLQRQGLDAAQAALLADNQIPPLTIRVNTLRTDPTALAGRLAGEGVEAVPADLSPFGLKLVAWDAAPLELPSYKAGLWLFQDEAAQLVTCLLGVRPGQQVLEVGAGRGGKTTHLAELMTDKGLLVALDNHRRRLREAQLHLQRWGVTVAQPLLADATRPLPLKNGSLDAVLLDAPCSSLGILRRHPEIKTRLKETDLLTFPPRQEAMLKRAADLLRPGGRLLYITCTTEPEENEDVINAFLSSQSDFHLATEPAWLPPAACSLVQPPGFYKTSPAEHNLDAFFAAVLVKE